MLERLAAGDSGGTAEDARRCRAARHFRPAHPHAQIHAIDAPQSAWWTRLGPRATRRATSRFWSIIWIVRKCESGSPAGATTMHSSARRLKNRIIKGRHSGLRSAEPFGRHWSAGARLLGSRRTSAGRLACSATCVSRNSKEAASRSCGWPSHRRSKSWSMAAVCRRP